MTTGLTADQQQLVRDNQRVAKLALRRFRNKYCGLLTATEMDQAANLGLVLAARHFREDEGVPFYGYAWRSVCGQILKSAKREAKQRAMVRALRQCVAGMRREGDVLSDSPEDARAELRRKAEQAVVAAVLGASHDDPLNALIGEQRRTAVAASLAALEPAERTIVEEHYLNERQLKELPDELGLSYISVRRYHRRALGKLALSLKRHRSHETRACEAG